MKGSNRIKGKGSLVVVPSLTEVIPMRNDGFYDERS